MEVRGNEVEDEEDEVEGEEKEEVEILYSPGEQIIQQTELS